MKIKCLKLTMSSKIKQGFKDTIKIIYNNLYR